MTKKIHITSDILAPQGARCSHCGTSALVQCSCCEHTMCLAHAVFFVTPGRSQETLAIDYVECQSCDEQDEPKAAESSDI
jgi:hypothetical protein